MNSSQTNYDLTRDANLALNPQCYTPLVSIIVVCFNDRDEVSAVIDNVHPFRGPNAELIIIDGASSDGTRELLERSADRIDYWVSEPDGGIYEAMNKGIAAARGEFILHLNAGDRLIELPVLELRQCLQSNIDIVSARVLMDNELVFIPRTRHLMRIDNGWHHQGTFYRRLKHLGYRSDYRVFGDFELNQRSLKAGHSYILLRTIVASHRNDGVSNQSKFRHEVFRSIYDHFGLGYLLLAFIRFQINKLRRSFHYLRQSKH